MPMRLLDFFFPNVSLARRAGDRLTEEQQRQLRSTPVILEEPQLRRLELRFLDRVVAAARYHEGSLLKDALHAYKYDRVRWLGEELGSLLTEASFLVAPGVDAPWCLPEAAPVLCPVPLHWTRLFNRGFNQAKELAEILGRARGWETRHLVRRIRPTGHQAWRKREERKVAVRDAFSYRYGSVFSFSLLNTERKTKNVPQRIILIDDIATTGATLNACAKVLKQAGVGRVEALVVAHG